MKTIVFDIDGVLADFIRGAMDLARALFPEKNVPFINTLTHENWDIYPGLDKSDVDLLWAYIRSNPKFWTELHPLISPFSFAYIQDLIKKGNSVYFATNRRTPGALQATVAWLVDMLEYAHPSVVVTHRKGEFCKVVDADFYIDDKSENVDCAIWMTDGKTKSYSIIRPYNSGEKAPHSKRAIRINCVTEFLEDINNA